MRVPPACLPSLHLDSSAVGQQAAAAFDFRLGARWVWGSVGLCWGYLVLFTVAGAAALRWTNPPAPRPTGTLGGVVGCRAIHQWAVAGLPPYIQLQTGMFVSMDHSEQPNKATPRWHPTSCSV